MSTFSRRALLIWSVGLLAYGVAVFHRSSLAVAGVEAADRLGVGAALLGLLSVVQLATYAIMQIPVGMLLDRYGSRALIASGAASMAVGQVLFAFAHDLPAALAARVLIGVGDAMTFISLLRVVAMWFPPRRNPLLVQLTGVLGQLGALASAVPLVVLLRDVGWTATFLFAGGLGAAAALLVVVALRDRPRDADPTQGPASLAEVRRGLKTSWAQPGTKLGVWTHFVTQFSGSVFALMWGFPFLVEGQGLSPATAATLLSTLTVAWLVSGPLIGHFCGRLPYHRSTLVFAITGSTVAAWTVVLLWPGRAPMWLLVVLVIVLATNGPASAIGFDYARSFNAASRLGGASGIVNVGGFTAAIVLIAGIGIVLDLTGATRSLDAFRWAFAVQYPLWTLGLVQVVRYRRAARRRLAERHPDALEAIRRGQTVVAAD